MAKKSFAANMPVEMFITKPAAAVSAPETVVNGMEKAPVSRVRFEESKSRRVQILVQPSVFDAMSRAAASRGISNNEFINEAIKAQLGI